MGSALNHITPLVINNFGGEDTHARAQTHTHAYRRSRTEAILRNKARTGRAPGLTSEVVEFSSEELNNTMYDPFGVVGPTYKMKVYS